MGSDALIWVSAALAIAGVAVLRLSWARAMRSAPLNMAGWGALLAALVVADLGAGEWGIAVAVLVSTFAAFVALAFAAAKPARKARAKTVRTSHRGNDELSPTRRSSWLTRAAR